ncbi:DUF4335 domain-containing protein [Trichothermofontia sp.]
MTIQRHYRLPNCTLVLEGLGDATELEPTGETRPLMATLLNAECHISEHDALIGGREFFEQLVQAVNLYVQELFSGVRSRRTGESRCVAAGEAGHSQHHTSPLVQLERVGNLHRLTIQPQGIATSNPTALMQADITTVQLFDLVEAIDQFRADARTLPDMQIPLQPVSRKDAPAPPIREQVTPIALGITSVAVAGAAAFFLLPVPETQRPRQPEWRAGTETTASPTVSPSPTASPNVGEGAAASIEITDADQLRRLRTQLYDAIDKEWDKPEFDETLTYKVSVDLQGTIVGYAPDDETSRLQVDRTPLPNLVFIPVEGGTATQGPIALFKVVFTPRGVLEVSPWRGLAPEAEASPASPSPTTASPTTPAPATASPTTVTITDPAAIAAIVPALYERIDTQWQTKPTFETDLVYRVEANADGQVLRYEPTNPEAGQYATEIPLPQLQQATANATPGQTPQAVATFKVVFTPRGVLQVSPWEGYQ